MKHIKLFDNYHDFELDKISTNDMPKVQLYNTSLAYNNNITYNSDGLNNSDSDYSILKFTVKSDLVNPNIYTKKWVKFEDDESNDDCVTNLFSILDRYEDIYFFSSINNWYYIPMLNTPCFDTYDNLNIMFITNKNYNFNNVNDIFSLLHSNDIITLHMVNSNTRLYMKDDIFKLIFGYSTYTDTTFEDGVDIEFEDINVDDVEHGILINKNLAIYVIVNKNNYTKISYNTLLFDLTSNNDNLSVETRAFNIINNDLLFIYNLDLDGTEFEGEGAEYYGREYAENLWNSILIEFNNDPDDVINYLKNNPPTLINNTGSEQIFLVFDDISDNPYYLELFPWYESYYRTIANNINDVANMFKNRLDVTPYISYANELIGIADNIRNIYQKKLTQPVFEDLDPIDEEL